jgi:ATP-binding cassette subfamily B protein
MAEKTKAFNFAVLRKLLGLATPYKLRFYTAVGLTLLMAFLGPLRPYLIQYTIDEHVSKGNLYGLKLMTLLIFSLLLFQAIAQVWSTILSNLIAQNIIFDLRKKVYHFLLKQRVSFFDKTPVGTLVTRNVNDIETVADIFSEGLINITGDIIQIVFILAFMFWRDWKLSLVSLSVLPLLLYAGYIFKEKVRVSFETVRTQVARLNTFVQEHIQGMLVVQAFNREEQEYEKFKTINAIHRDENIKSILYYSVFFPVVEVIAAISIGLVVWYGAGQVLAHQASAGIIIAFIMYINMFFRPIRQLADRFNTLQMGMVASGRLFDLMDKTADTETTGSYAPEKLIGEVEFRHVDFSYKKNEPVLKDISFKVMPSQTLALVGETGSGKTSTLALISKFYEADAGEITIDKIPIHQWDIHALRSKMGLVLQDVFLFSGSILDNIRLFDDSISDEAIINTAKEIGAHEFISKLPLGYQEQLAERGSNLSVGQRQLISFVRAMVRNPSLLILDEATSSIDREMEQVIQRALSIMMKGRTTLVIAHRLSTVENANRILVMHHGQIAESGTHTELLAQQGIYASLHQKQFSH